MTRIATSAATRALATIALVFCLASAPASAQNWDHGNKIRGILFPPIQAGRAAEVPEHLARHRPSRQGTHYEFRWWYDYSGGKSVQRGLSLSDEQKVPPAGR